MSRGTVWAAVTSASAIAAGLGVRWALRRGWARTHDDGEDASPPENPGDPSTAWTDAVLWGAVSGAAVGLARVAGRQLATSGWRSLTGREPPIG